jgi:DNA-directed RNA polymerase specialized sigma24 family protein
LLSLAFRILRSPADAEDVVQEAWTAFDRADTSLIENVPAWLTTVTARLCVDLLRRRRQAHREPSVDCCDDQEGPLETALLAVNAWAAFADFTKADFATKTAAEL